MIYLIIILVLINLTYFDDFYVISKNTRLHIHIFILFPNRNLNIKILKKNIFKMKYIQNTKDYAVLMQYLYIINALTH